MPARVARHLQREVVLVRPEPRHGVVLDGLPEERARCGLGLLPGVGHGLEADQPAALLAAYAGAVAERDDVGVGSAAAPVDDDAGVDLEAGSRGEVGIGADTHPHDDEIRRHGVAAGEAYAADAVVALDGLDGHPGRDAYALLAVHPLVERGHGRGRDAGEHAVGGLEHGDVVAAHAQRRGGLEADVAAAHEHDPCALRARRGQRGEVVADALHVGDGAQQVHAGQIGALDGETHRSRTGGEGELVVGQRLAAVQHHGVRIAVDRGDPALDELDVVLVEEVGRTQQELARLPVAGEEALRQRRPLVRQPALVADHGHRARPPALPQGDGEGDAGVTGADDQAGLRCLVHVRHPDRPGDGQATGVSVTIMRE